MTPTAGPGGRREHRPPLMLEIDHATVVRLRPQPAARAVSVQRLVLDLIDAIARDKLAAAVLDVDESQVGDEP